VRLAVAGTAIVDEETAQRVEHGDPTGLDEPQLAALRHADAYMANPSSIDADLRRHFSAAQAVELTLDVMAFNKQKIKVALGTDEPVDAERLTPFTFDAAGRAVFSDAAAGGTRLG
jgi:hypothetical protein